MNANFYFLSSYSSICQIDFFPSFWAFGIEKGSCFIFCPSFIFCLDDASWNSSEFWLVKCPTVQGFVCLLIVMFFFFPLILIIHAFMALKSIVYFFLRHLTMDDTYLSFRRAPLARRFTGFFGGKMWIIENFEMVFFIFPSCWQTRNEQWLGRDGWWLVFLHGGCDVLEYYKREGKKKENRLFLWLNTCWCRKRVLCGRRNEKEKVFHHDENLEFHFDS